MRSYEYKELTARAGHDCGGCGTTILKGERYVRDSVGPLCSRCVPTSYNDGRARNPLARPDLDAQSSAPGIATESPLSNAQ